MKAVQSGDGAVRVVELDEPPGTGELLDMQATSICASDLSYIRFGSTHVLGHELAGRRSDGSPVVVEAIYGCLECDQCQRGAYNLCATHGQRALGIFADGGMAEQFRAPPERMVDVPDGLDLRDACLVEPASVSWHALRLAGVMPGSRVAVVGAGALGLLAAAGALRMGAAEVALEARHPHQREASARLGASVGTSGVYDVVVEAAGSLESLARCGELVGRRAGASSFRACTSGRWSSSGTRCSARRRASSRRSATAPTTAYARDLTRRQPCWSRTPRSRVP